MSFEIQFCGAARTVTGSRHLLRVGGKAFLVDCGLFQGPREIRERNWQPLPFDPSEVEAVLLTHAHQDHIGYLPKLVREGYRGPLFATRATIGLSRISLPDSGRLQEEEARYRNRHNLTRHRPALPLFTERDAYVCLKRFEAVGHKQMQSLPGGVSWRFLPAGHILGSAFVELYLPTGERILFSGDLGRYGTPILLDPHPADFAEYLVLESTYGDRVHSDEDTDARLEEILKTAYERGGAVLVPSFAIGRTQELLYLLKNLQKAGRMPRMPIFVDSPMASSTTLVYRQEAAEHDAETKLAFDQDDDPTEPEGLTFVRDREESKALNVRQGPFVVISGSGMANGGRIVHHLAQRLNDPATTVLFTGYQAEGTLGRAILEGAADVGIMGRTVPVRARVEKLNALSAHADQAEILKWLGGFRQAPRATFLVHGEPRAQDALRARIEKELGWRVEVPEHLQRYSLETERDRAGQGKTSN
jgi:metallo-beta-lactamase family protein